jgi:hypothetical protein
MESFIKPLKFKFLVENLEKEQEVKKDDNKKEDEKIEVYKKLYEAYEKFKV